MKSFLKRLLSYLLLVVGVAVTGAAVYYFGVAHTVILLAVIGHVILSRLWAGKTAKLIVESQNRLGENDKKLLARIRAVEDKLDAR